MKVSNLIISKKTMAKGNRQMDILWYLQRQQQKNPRFMKDTTLRHLSKCYAESANCNENTAIGTLSRMCKKNILIVSRLSSGRTARANFRINYLYPNLPHEFIDGATDEDRGFIEDIYDRLQKHKKAGENYVLDGKNAMLVAKTSKPMISKKEAKAKTPTQTPSRTIPVTTPVSVEPSHDGKSISITINLNLNGIA